MSKLYIIQHKRNIKPTIFQRFVAVECIKSVLLMVTTVLSRFLTLQVLTRQLRETGTVTTRKIQHLRSNDTTHVPNGFSLFSGRQQRLWKKCIKN